MKLLILFSNWLKKKTIFYSRSSSKKLPNLNFVRMKRIFSLLKFAKLCNRTSRAKLPKWDAKKYILLFVSLRFCLVFAYRSVLVLFLFLFTRMQIEIYQFFFCHNTNNNVVMFIQSTYQMS